VGQKIVVWERWMMMLMLTIRYVASGLSSGAKRRRCMVAGKKMLIGVL